jgi:uncharacterized protein (DUF952 family)
MFETDTLETLQRQLLSLERQISSLKRTIARIGSSGDERIVYESYFDSETIYHLTPRGFYESIPASLAYLPQDYDKDGFIHCTRGADLLAFVANRFYREVPSGFLMLVIDVRALTAPLKYEALDPAVPYPFPHIYGPLNREAISEAVTMIRDADGTFLVPPFTNQSR